MKLSQIHFLTFIFLFLKPLLLFSQDTPGDYFLELHGLEFWEFDLDHDADGFSTREEYWLGTNPFEATGALQLDIRRENPFSILSWPSNPGALYQLYSSESLERFDPLGEAVLGDGMAVEMEVDSDFSRLFFQIGPLPPEDRDGDGLSSVEEGLLGTDPDDADTDNDGRLDGAEVFLMRTDPLAQDDLGGTLRGFLFNDADNDGDKD